MSRGIIPAVTMLTAVAFNLLLLVHVGRNSHFSGDDIITLIQAHSLPFWRFVAEPINEHFVPLHRVISYVLDRLAPMNFELALAVLCAWHVLGCVYLYKVLKLVESSCAGASGSERGPLGAVGWLILGLYATHVYVGPLYGWWTAGLHRLPFIAASTAAVYYYLLYRESHRGLHGLLCSACILIGMGFYIKGVLIPICLVGVELAFPYRGTARQRLRQSGLVFSWLIASLLYVFLWRRFQPKEVQGINSDIAFQLEFLRVSAFILRDATIGRIYAENLFTLGKQLPIEHVVAFISSAAWLLLLGFIGVRRRQNLRVLLILAGILIAHTLIISLSQHRTKTFGVLTTVMNTRYYFEMVPWIAIFIYRALIPCSLRKDDGISLETATPRAGALASESAVVGASSGRHGAAAAAVFIAVLEIVAYNALVSSERKVNHSTTRDFIENLEADAGRIRHESSTPLRIVDGPVPPYIVAWPPEYARASLVLPAMGIPAVSAPPGPGVHRLLESGHLADSL